MLVQGFSAKYKLSNIAYGFYSSFPSCSERTMVKGSDPAPAIKIKRRKTLLDLFMNLKQHFSTKSLVMP
jgi:hypothetical protein